MNREESTIRTLLPIFLLILAMAELAILSGCSREIPLPAKEDNPVYDVERFYISCNRWPRTTNFSDMAEDVARLSVSATPEGRVLEAFDWTNRLLLADDPAPHEFDPQQGKLEEVSDLLKVLNVYGHHWCSGHAGVMAWLCRGLGYRARRLDLTDGPHAITEISYRDEDGIRRYHAFDTYMGWYTYSRNGDHIASADEITVDPSLLLNPSRKTYPDFFLKEGPREWLAKILQGKIIEYPDTYSYYHAAHDIRWKIRNGERIMFLWGNLGKYYYNSIYTRLVSGGPTEKYAYREIHGEGAEYPQNIPYLRPYMTPIQTTTNWFEKGTLCRKYGNGRIVFEPEDPQELADGLSSYSKGAHITDRAFHIPNKGDAHFTFDVACPYVIVDSTISIRALACAPDAKITVSVSTDKGQTWKPVRNWDSSRILLGINVNPIEILSATDLANPFGHYEYSIKVAIQSSSKAKDTEIDFFRVETVFQNNIFVLPRLMPGVNVITMEGLVFSNSVLEVEYFWKDSTGEHKADHRTRFLPDTFDINLPEQPIEQIRCRSLTIKSRRAPAETVQVIGKSSSFVPSLLEHGRT